MQPNARFGRAIVVPLDDTAAENMESWDVQAEDRCEAFILGDDFWRLWMCGLFEALYAVTGIPFDYHEQDDLPVELLPVAIETVRELIAKERHAGTAVLLRRFEEMLVLGRDLGRTVCVLL